MQQNSPAIPLCLGYAPLRMTSASMITANARLLLSRIAIPRSIRSLYARLLWDVLPLDGVYIRNGRVHDSATLGRGER